MVWDVLHGYRGMRYDAFERIVPTPEGVSIDFEMVVWSYRQRLAIRVFPVRERPRMSGSTHFGAWSTGKRLLLYLWHEIRRPALTG